MNIRQLFSSLIVTCAAIFCTISNATPTLLINSNGILTGAKNVYVGGTLYDVTFKDGNCGQIFNGCTAFIFTTFEEAANAGNALLNQVFVDGAAGNFDSEPSKVNGCTNEIYDYFCVSLIPFGRQSSRVLTAIASNWSPLVDYDVDNVSADVYSYPFDRNTVTDMNKNFAVFELSAQESNDIPEPSSIVLLCISLAGFVLARRRKS